MLRPACIALACLLAAGPACSKHEAAAAPPEHLPLVPDGTGRRAAASDSVGLKLAERRLRFQDGLACPGAPACAERLEALRGEDVTVDIDRSATMGALSEALAALANGAEPRETFCLRVRDSSSSRCVPFRPVSGREFGEWLDAEKPLAKLRIILRSDGMEVVADGGKVPGPDRFGPSLPPVMGRPDLQGLERLAAALSARFPAEEEAAVAPSPALPFEQIAQVLATLSGPDGSRFEKLWLVYP